MTDIGIVTQGEYSSYSVVAAFTTVEAADEFAAISNGNRDDYESLYVVERVDLDPPNPAVVPRSVIEPREPDDDDYELPEEVAARLAQEKLARDGIVASVMAAFIGMARCAAGLPDCRVEAHGAAAVDWVRGPDGRLVCPNCATHWVC